MAPTLLQKITGSCSVALAHQEHVTICKEALLAKAQEIAPDAVHRSCKPFRYPCKFASIEEEITFAAVLRLLDFGSGCNALLEKQGKNSKDVIQIRRLYVQMGVIGMHITSTPMDKAGLLAFSQQQVTTLFGVDSHEDCDSGIPGVTMSKPGKMAPWTRYVRECLNSAGQTLESEDLNSLGALILNVLNDQKATRKPPSASGLVAELVDMIPGFADSGLVGDELCLFHRKAQLLVVDLYLRFRDEDPRFAFADMADISADSGAPLCALLEHWNILKYSEELKAAVAAGQVISTGAKERAMRAACVEGVRQLAEACSGVSAWELSRWMTQLIESKHVEGLKPHLTMDIQAY